MKAEETINNENQTKMIDLDKQMNVVITGGFNKIKYDSTEKEFQGKTIVFIFDKNFNSIDEIDIGLDYIYEHFQGICIFFDFYELKTLDQIKKAIKVTKGICNKIKSKSSIRTKNQKVVIKDINIMTRGFFIRQLISKNFISENFENTYIDQVDNFDTMINGKYKLGGGFDSVIGYFDKLLNGINEYEIIKANKPKEIKLDEPPKIEENKQENKKLETQKDEIIHTGAIKANTQIIQVNKNDMTIHIPMTGKTKDGTGLVDKISYNNKKYGNEIYGGEMYSGIHFIFTFYQGYSEYYEVALDFNFIIYHSRESIIDFDLSRLNKFDSIKNAIKFIQYICNQIITTSNTKVSRERFIKSIGISLDKFINSLKINGFISEQFKPTYWPMEETLCNKILNDSIKNSSASYTYKAGGGLNQIIKYFYDLLEEMDKCEKIKADKPKEIKSGEIKKNKTVQQVNRKDKRIQIDINNEVKKIDYIPKDDSCASGGLIIFGFNKDFNSIDKINIEPDVICKNLETLGICFDFIELKKLDQITNAIKLSKQICIDIEDESANIELKRVVVLHMYIVNITGFINYLKDNFFINKNFPNEHPSASNNFYDQKFNNIYEYRVSDGFDNMIQYFDSLLYEIDKCEKIKLEEQNKQKAIELEKQKKQEEENKQKAIELEKQEEEQKKLEEEQEKVKAIELEKQKKLEEAQNKQKAIELEKQEEEQKKQEEEQEKVKAIDPSQDTLTTKEVEITLKEGGYYNAVIDITGEFNKIKYTLNGNNTEKPIEFLFIFNENFNSSNKIDIGLDYIYDNVHKRWIGFDFSKLKTLNQIKNAIKVAEDICKKASAIEQDKKPEYTAHINIKKEIDFIEFLRDSKFIGLDFKTGHQYSIKKTPNVPLDYEIKYFGLLLDKMDEFQKKKAIEEQEEEARLKEEEARLKVIEAAQKKLKELQEEADRLKKEQENKSLEREEKQKEQKKVEEGVESNNESELNESNKSELNEIKEVESNNESELDESEEIDPSQDTLTTKEVEITLSKDRSSYNAVIDITNGVNKIKYTRSDTNTNITTTSMGFICDFIFDKDFNSNNKIDIGLDYMYQNFNNGWIGFDFSKLKELDQIKNAIKVAEDICKKRSQITEDKDKIQIYIKEFNSFIKFLRDNKFIRHNFPNLYGGFEDNVENGDDYDTWYFNHLLKEINEFKTNKPKEPQKKKLDEISKSKPDKIKKDELETTDPNQDTWSKWIEKHKWKILLFSICLFIVGVAVVKHRKNNKSKKSK